MHRFSGTFLSLVLLLPLAAWADEPAPAGTAPEDVVQRATASHLDVLNGLIDKVPEPAREKIQKAIEVSRRGGDKALEALHKAHMDAEEAVAPTTGAQVRGLERAIQAIEEATDRTTAHLESVLEHVPDSAKQAITAAIDKIEANHADVLARLEALLERGVSTNHPPERPDRSDKPEAARPDRPETPTQVGRPDFVRPERPEHPARPEGRP